MAVDRSSKTSRLILSAVLTFQSALAAQSTAITERVSVDSSGNEANNASAVSTQLHSISADGRFVVFTSAASNLVPEVDANGVSSDLFVHDRLTDITERVGVAAAGNQSDTAVAEASISADGRFVAFHSFATNLVPDVPNGRLHVYVHDRLTGATERVSTDSAGIQGNQNSLEPVLSGDGRFVVFRSGATNLVPGDTNVVQDVFIHDRVLHTTERVSVDSDENQGNAASGLGYSISQDGRFVAFESRATNLVPNDTNARNDIFVRDRAAGDTVRVSVSSAGVQSNAFSNLPFISADGRFVVFGSGATNLVPDPNPFGIHIFLHDRSTATTERVSVDSASNPGNGESIGRPSISADGRFVVFLSSATNLVLGDANLIDDVFLRDRLSNTTERVNVSTTGMEANHPPRSASISTDGHVVVFDSLADTLVDGDTNGFFDVFVRDFAGAPTADVSITKDDSPDPISVSRQLTYTFTVTNAGPDPATGVVITDVLPTSVAFVSADARCLYASSTHTVTCALNGLDNDESIAVAIVVGPMQRGTVTNTATVTADQMDPNPDNNAASASTAVVSADLSITKTHSPDALPVGKDLTFSLTIANTGPDTANGVTVIDALPASMGFVSGAAGCLYEFAAHTVTCDAGTLIATGVAVFDIVVRPVQGGSIVNTASVTADEIDPDTSNNTASDTVRVRGSANRPPACDTIDRPPKAQTPPTCR